MTDRPTGQRRVPGDVLVHLRRTRDHLDRHFAEPFDLDHLAGLAGMSRYHFLRSFALTYGVTPAAYLAGRRVERAQDLLRAANLTVTEVCHAVGYSSLGSFSSRFRAIVGESPSDFQRRYAAAGNPRIPGCYVFMAGLVERHDAGRDAGRDERTATQEKHDGADPS
jgi:AraC-like DNA-binding protein